MVEPVDARRSPDRPGRAAGSADLHERLERLWGARTDATASPDPGRPDGDTRPVRGGVDDSLHRIAQLEEMVARTHERAAELYETWSARQTGPRPAGLEVRARRHREAAAVARSVEHLAVRALRGFEVRVEAGAPADAKVSSLVALVALEHLRTLVDRRIEDVVAGARRAGATWAEVAAALRVTRQTAHQRYRHERT